MIFVSVLPQKISIGNGISCRPSVISYDVTLRGGLSAGQYTPIGHVDGMEACVNLCCKRNTCDIALMLRDSCYSITCASEELCEEVPAPSSNFYPRLSYVRRDIEGHGKKGANHLNCLLCFVFITFHLSEVMLHAICNVTCKMLYVACYLSSLSKLHVFCFVWFFFFSLFFEPCFIWFLT